jgi:hypothetical protein
MRSIKFALVYYDAHPGCFLISIVIGRWRRSFILLLLYRSSSLFCMNWNYVELHDVKTPFATPVCWKSDICAHNIGFSVSFWRVTPLALPTISGSGPSSSSQLTQYQLDGRLGVLGYPKTERYCLSRLCFVMMRHVTKTLSWKRCRWTAYWTRLLNSLLGGAWVEKQCFLLQTLSAN